MKSVICLIIVLLTGLSGCASNNDKESATASGTIIGAATGAFVGEHNNNPLGGAILGATAGAVTGNLIGETVAQRNAAYEAKFHADQRVLREQAQQLKLNSITIEQLTRMASANVSEDVIIAEITKRGAAQQLSIDDIIQLTKDDMSPALIKAYQSASTPRAIATSGGEGHHSGVVDPVVVQRHYHHRYSPRYYEPPVAPRGSGVFIGIGNQ